MIFSGIALYYGDTCICVYSGTDDGAYCVVTVVVLMMERAREMMLLSAVLLYLANSVCSQGTPARSVATVY